MLPISHFIKVPENRRRFSPLRPKNLERKLGQPKIPLRSPRPALLGTAFDYLVRFELKKRNPSVIESRWIAERAIGVAPIVELLIRPDVGCAPDWHDKADNIVREARWDFEAYCTPPKKRRRPLPIDIRQLTEHAIRLAKLDPMFRAGVADQDVQGVDPDDVEELLAMLELVPFDRISSCSPLLLNPALGMGTMAGDIDFICGNMLLELKVTKLPTIDPQWLDQLLGYFLLARAGSKEGIPEIGRAALYFARHGVFREFDATEWTRSPEFPAMEEWFRSTIGIRSPATATSRSGRAVKGAKK